ncbi:MAG: prolyl oligopeptidase family serine peptidase [Fibrobacteres bacterium]|nr:prolyl oligopeptidase family serine peptidase [Fibrobacterota bacterium]
MFFTDLGWAVLEVNYRGSTGYGERYRQALAGRWGNWTPSIAAGEARHGLPRHRGPLPHGDQRRILGRIHRAQRAG